MDTPGEERGAGQTGGSPSGVTVEEWFRQLPHDNDTPKDEEENALKDFLTGDTSAEAAARGLTSVVARNVEQGQGEAQTQNDLARIWNFVNDAAEDLPGVQAKLLDLLEAIQRLPNLRRRGGSEAVVWRELPGFANDVRDRWGVCAATKSDQDRFNSKS